MKYSNLQEAQDACDISTQTIIHDRDEHGIKVFEVVEIPDWLKVQIELKTWENSKA